jgi:hypothetical protein
LEGGMSANWKNRIVGYGQAAPAELKANPANFRKHPAAQLEALRGSLNELGWVQAVIVNQNTGNVVDGHARLEEALRDGDQQVPVLYVNLTEEEEKKVLVVLDQITEMARRDGDALNAVLEDIEFEDQGLAALVESLKAEAETGVSSLAQGDDDEAAEKAANFNISYTIQFNDLQEQEAWFTFLEKLRAKWPDEETISRRICLYIDENEVMGG